MSIEIYTTAGCARCNIIKRYLKEHALSYVEHDFKGEGKDAFASFYRTNRSAIFRDQDGVEFPVFYDGKEVRQGVSVILSYLMAGKELDELIGRSALHGEWIDGFDLSGGTPAQANKLLDVVSFLKNSGLKLQVTTDGRNASALKALINNNLCDRVIMEVKSPASLYERLTGQELTDDELKQSIKLTAAAPDYNFFTTIAPLERKEGWIEFLTPAEIAETAKLIEEATGSKKHSYVLRPFDPKQAEDDRIKALEALDSGHLFKYRTAARRFQVKTEIEQ